MQNSPQKIIRFDGADAAAGGGAVARVEEFLLEVRHVELELRVRLGADVFDLHVFRSGRRRTPDHADLDGHLVGDALERELRLVLGHVAELKQDGPRLHLGRPEVNVALTLTHPSLGGLGGDGLVREHPDPDLGCTLSGAVGRDPARLELPAGDPASVQGLETEVTKGDAVPAGGESLDLAAEDATALDALGHVSHHAPPWLKEPWGVAGAPGRGPPPPPPPRGPPRPRPPRRPEPRRGPPRS